MTNYATIKSNKFGEYVDDPNQFKGDLDLRHDISYTEKSDADIILTASGTTAVNFQGVALGKLIVIEADNPIYVVLDGGAEQIICDPILVLSNQAPAAGKLVSLTIERVNAVDTMVKIRIKGE